jgi:hypothetical protein
MRLLLNRVRKALSLPPAIKAPSISEELTTALLSYLKDRGSKGIFICHYLFKHFPQQEQEFRRVLNSIGNQLTSQTSESPLDPCLESVLQVREFTLTNKEAVDLRCDFIVSLMSKNFSYFSKEYL